MSLTFDLLALESHKKEFVEVKIFKPNFVGRILLHPSEFKKLFANVIVEMKLQKKEKALPNEQVSVEITNTAFRYPERQKSLPVLLTMEGESRVLVIKDFDFKAAIRTT